MNPYSLWVPEVSWIATCEFTKISFYDMHKASNLTFLEGTSVPEAMNESTYILDYVLSNGHSTFLETRECLRSILYGNV